MLAACRQASPETASCDFITGLSDTSHLVCGKLTVPENHDEPDGRKIQIAYVILKARTDTAADYPLIYLSGGPGGVQLVGPNIDYWLGHPIREKRDIILFDQRGIGHSSALPSIKSEYYELMAANATAGEERHRVDELLETYKKACAAQGIQLQYYNTIQNAQDVGKLMEALGYERYNLLGGSYGTRLGRGVQDLYPEYLHAVIFNSPNPMKGDMLIDRLKSYCLALERVFAYCEGDSSCRAAYPGLRQTYLQTLASLEETPLKIEVNGQDFFVNAQDAVYLIRRRLYAADSREAVPALILELGSGGGPVLQQVIAGDLSTGAFFNFSMWLSVERYEMYHPENTAEAIQAVYDSLPLLPVRMGFFDAMYQAFGDWHPATLPEAQKAFQPSAIPTVIMVNQYDPVTPPENGYIFKEQLSNAYLFILDEGGHGGGDEDCRNKVMMAFMDAPGEPLDASCLNVYRGGGE